MKFGKIRDLLLTLLLILSVDGCNSDKKDVNAEGANSTSNISKDGDGTTTGTPIRNSGDKDVIPSGMTIPDENISSYIVSLSNATTDIQGEIDEWGIKVKIPCNITETNSPVTLGVYKKTFIIASSSTEDNESGIVATFAWDEQELNSSTKSFNAYITINDSKGNNDGRYEAKKLAINTSGIIAATFSYPTGDATIYGTLSLKIVSGILDRNFNVSTNGQYKHRFIYAPVTNPVTGRTWLNNNLGAEYADVNSSYFNPSKQATSSNDYRAYGSLFQWGRKADGHELIHWSDATHGEPLYGTTTTKADDPSNSLYIIKSYDWRVHSDDTLWASKSSANNVCPEGYRLPLNPNGASDGENEWFVEMSTWALDANGSISSYLKLPYAGHRYFSSGQMRRMTELGEYWTGSDYGITDAFSMYFGEEWTYNDTSSRASGLSVRCIKDQTPAEKTYSILLEIANEDRNHKSVITAAQLHEITPALKNINNDMVNKYRSYIERDDTNFSSPATIEEVQTMIGICNTSTNALLSDISQQHQEHNSTIRVEQLRVITPRLNQLQKANEKYYQSYIEGDTHFSSPTATIEEVQTMIDDVNSLNLPKHAILDRSFFKKTNGVFQHRFVYLPVESNTTGRTWLNNNLGAEYAKLNSSDYNPSQQATAIKDLLANGSLFQWGRKADGHELIEWSHLSGKYGTTPINSDNPDDSSLITGSDDWRVTSDDTLWASESSPNNVCPVGYRLPLNPNGANDGANEWYQETKDLTQNIGGLFHSFLKIPTTGIRNYNGNASIRFSDGGSSNYWSGSVRSDGKALSMGSNWGCLVASDYSARIEAFPVRCIKDQTPAERSATILKEIGDEHSNHKSVITIAQLKAITPALENINDDYQDIYRSYIASADTTFSFSSPATRDEVQQMITQVKNLNLPKNAILDRSFFTKTNGAFQHRFVYLPVTNPKTGRTWLNNNLGAEYAKLNSSDYNPSHQATAIDDHLAYGSLFEWGRKADGHELDNWNSDTFGTKKYGRTQIKSNNPSNPLYIGGDYDWRVNLDNTLWASESSANNVCPVGYRLPLDPNRADDGENEWYEETQTWSSKNQSGAINSVLKLPMSGRCHFGSNVIKEIGYEAAYWSGSANGDGDMGKNLDFYNHKVHSNANSAKTYGYNVRCIKDQTPAERSDSILLEIANEQSNHKSVITIAQLRAITPALNNIKSNYENIYRTYIATADNNFFSSPATRDEVQRMINIVNDNRIYELGSYDTAGNAKGVILSHDGTKAYIADYTNGLVIVDISDPARPTKLGSYNTTGVAWGVTLSNDGSKAYVADYENGLVIVDISDPVHPTKLGSVNTSGAAKSVTLSSDGSKAYLADWDHGLVIVDISNPALPRKIASYDTGTALNIALSSDGTKAYIADWENSLVILDISYPYYPTKLGSYHTSGYLQSVTLSSDGTKAYLSDDANALEIVDISDPAHPTKLGLYDTAGHTEDVALSSNGQKAYIADWENGLVIIDISDPAHTIKLNSYDTAGYAYDVTLSSDGTKAYIADGKNGLVIIGGIK